MTKYGIRLRHLAGAVALAWILIMIVLTVLLFVSEQLAAVFIRSLAIPWMFLSFAMYPVAKRILK